jgi:anti-sigma factor RsiW
MNVDRHLTEDDLGMYLDAELGAADRHRVAAHLDACERCRARRHALESLFSALDHPGLTSAPAPDIAPAVMARIRADTRPAGWRRAAVVHGLQAVAAVALLLCGWPRLVRILPFAPDRQILPLQGLATGWRSLSVRAEAMWQGLGVLATEIRAETLAGIGRLSLSCPRPFSAPQLPILALLLVTFWLVSNSLLLRQALTEAVETGRR